jgi:hypothetical protein
MPLGIGAAPRKTAIDLIKIRVLVRAGVPWLGSGNYWPLQTRSSDR